jgi:BspA type Leucine rich repeat region (6 copies)/Putative Ig domain
MTIVYQTILIGNTYSRAVNAPGAELFLALNLPLGLSMTTNGVISGTPTQVGRNAVSILARGPSGTGVAVLDLTVSPQQIPVITSATIINQEALTPLSYQITAVTPPPSSLPILSFGAANLPTGLTVNTSTGLITGTPSVSSQSPTVTVVSTISATNANGTGQTYLTFNFTQRPVITSSLTPLIFTSGIAITPYTITASKSPISFAASPLPAGLTLNSSTGVISGTPSSVPATTLVSLTASNGVLTSLPAVLSITVQPPETVFTYDDGGTTTSFDLTLSTSSYDTNPSRRLTGVAIGTAVTGIAAYAFLGRDFLTSIAIPNNVTNIGNAAFQNCTSLTNVSIGTGVINISQSLFEGCTVLQSVSLPNTLQIISSAAFKLCGQMTSIVLPTNNFQTISSYAFQSSGITSISIPAT